MFMDRIYLIIYLVYGFVYILFGLRILSVNKQHIHTSLLVKSFKFVALFGITHGISEWLTMIRISELFLEYDSLIMNSKFILKMISFVFLMTFGINVLSETKLKITLIKYLPSIFATVYMLVFSFLLITQGVEYLINNRTFNVIYIRYFLGLSSGLLAAYAVFTVIQTMSKVHFTLRRNHLLLMIAFIIYAIVDGLIVRPTDFFPGNIINNHNFLLVFGFRVQFLKVLVGIILYFTVAKVIQSLDQDLTQSIQKIQLAAVEMDARCKIGLEMHDLIVQDMYGIKLKVLTLIKRDRGNQELDKLRNDIEEALKKTREFMQDETFKRINFQDVLDNIHRLKTIFEQSNTMKIGLSIDDTMKKSNSSNNYVWAQLYFTIQEALLNAFKHSKANYITISIYKENNELITCIRDNGVGVNFENIDVNKSHGLTSMKQRIESLNGSFKLESNQKGTVIMLTIPIEGVSL